MKNKVTSLFADRLQDLIAESGKTISELSSSEGIGISSGSLSKYQNDAAEPGITALVKIADYFGVSFDYLLGKTNCKKRENINISERTGLSEKAVEYLCNMDKIEFKNGIAAHYEYEYMCPSKILSFILESEHFEIFMIYIQASIYQAYQNLKQREFTPEDWEAINHVFDIGQNVTTAAEYSKFQLTEAQKKMNLILEEVVQPKKEII